jgi:hypothetical protein
MFWPGNFGMKGLPVAVKMMGMEIHGMPQV